MEGKRGGKEQPLFSGPVGGFGGRERGRGLFGVFGMLSGPGGGKKEEKERQSLATHNTGRRSGRQLAN